LNVIQQGEQVFQIPPGCPMPFWRTHAQTANPRMSHLEQWVENSTPALAAICDRAYQ
jgi:hypothetical protein